MNMLEYLNEVDTQLLLFLNGAHNAYFDELFWLVTGKFAWVPMILVLLFCSFRKNWKVGVSMVLAIAVVITLCDQVSSGIIKDAVCRLRPTRNPDISSLIHVVNDYRGGQYGFVSSHAANSFGVATFLLLVFRNKMFTWVILLWAAVLSYSRIYLGVHYPGDIVCGGLLGVALGAVVYCIYIRVKKLYFFASANSVDGRDAMWLSFATIGNILLLVATATIIYAMK